MGKVKVKELTVSEFRELVSNAVKESVQDIIEDYLALNSESYLSSIEKAREDYKKGRIKGFEELFDV